MKQVSRAGAGSSATVQLARADGASFFYAVPIRRAEGEENYRSLFGDDGLVSIATLKCESHLSRSDR